MQVFRGVVDPRPDAYMGTCNINTFPHARNSHIHTFTFLTKLDGSKWFLAMRLVTLLTDEPYNLTALEIAVESDAPINSSPRNTLIAWLVASVCTQQRLVEVARRVTWREVDSPGSAIRQRQGVPRGQQGCHRMKLAF